MLLENRVSALEKEMADLKRQLEEQHQLVFDSVLQKIKEKQDQEYQRMIENKNTILSLTPEQREGRIKKLYGIGGC